MGAFWCRSRNKPRVLRWLQQKKPREPFLQCPLLFPYRPQEKVLFGRGPGVYRPIGGLSSSVISEIDRLATGAEDEVIPSEFAYQKARSIVAGA